MDGSKVMQEQLPSDSFVGRDKVRSRRCPQCKPITVHCSVIYHPCRERKKRLSRPTSRHTVGRDKAVPGNFSNNQHLINFMHNPVSFAEGDDYFLVMEYIIHIQRSTFAVF